MHATTRMLCNAKVGIAKDGIAASTYKGLKKELYST